MSSTGAPSSRAKAPSTGPLPARTPIEIGLNAAIVTVEAERPLILVVPGDAIERRDALPFGPFDPLAHRTLEIGLRAWVSEQTALKLGYVEQLYTFGDRGRHAMPGDTGPHVVSVGYLALTRLPEDFHAQAARFEDWYAYLPWEDWRDGRPAVLDEVILPALECWAAEPAHPSEAQRGPDRRTRLLISFGLDGARWDDERVLERYELLYSAGLLAEALSDGREAALRRGNLPPLGRPMRFDHRRILATAIGRLRGKLKYRPVVFELMPPTFTLTELQRTVEALAGTHLHKQNFRRLVEQTALVEPTGGYHTSTGGRPARLFRFRREAVLERPSPGLRFGPRG
ncbi:hypothetical protein EDC22_107110 [Tepidamorphus gemmatus]|uniref:NrtR DNA-binding winged helix domain-containing protein n=1 Tax=Tepidamorphus gemmatus TaxID=747076 RepID=A0A4R3M738_9HYPH|nr:NAD regulator [Tepidamorphus gemmatus]TCT09264.1 hypothetical protein EDC22_107110 [Tepidamorphus gemmatus]